MVEYSDYMEDLENTNQDSGDALSDSWLDKADEDYDYERDNDNDNE